MGQQKAPINKYRSKLRRPQAAELADTTTERADTHTHKFQAGSSIFPGVHRKATRRPWCGGEEAGRRDGHGGERQ